MKADEEKFEMIKERYGDDFLRLLQDLNPDIKIPEPPQNMAQEFDDEMRRQARASLKRLGSFALCVYGMFAFGMLTPIIFPKPKGIDLEGWFQLALVMFGGATFVVASVWLRGRQLMNSSDVLNDVAMAEGRRPKPSAQSILLATIFLWVFADFAVREGLTYMLSWTISVAAIMLGLTRFLRSRLKKQRMRDNPELWAWWYDTPDEKLSS